MRFSQLIELMKKDENPETSSCCPKLLKVHVKKEYQEVVKLKRSRTKNIIDSLYGVSLT